VIGWLVDVWLFEFELVGKVVVGIWLGRALVWLFTPARDRRRWTPVPTARVVRR
jgi:NhaP-type Na+/H+ or K+/H+ antiporter